MVLRIAGSLWGLHNRGMKNSAAQKMKRQNGKSKERGGLRWRRFIQQTKRSPERKYSCAAHRFRRRTSGGWRLIDPDGKRFKSVLISKGNMDGKRIVTFWVYPQPGPEPEKKS